MTLVVSGRLQLPMICLITDTSLVGLDRLAQVVGETVEAGVNLIQLREKRLRTHELLDLAYRLRQVVAPPALLLINGRADIAQAVGADGVHLPGDGLPTPRTRQLLGPGSVLGRSVHSAAEVELAVAKGGMDYIEFGTVFPSRSHPGGATLGLAGLTRATGRGVPILAVGGITTMTAAAVIAGGADGIAVISAILGPPSPGRAARDLVDAVRTSFASREQHASCR